MEREHEYKITIQVSGENVVMPTHFATVGAILTEAGLVPVEQYRLVRDDGNHAYTNYAEEIPIHNGERFTALFNGQTPTS